MPSFVALNIDAVKIINSMRPLGTHWTKLSYTLLLFLNTVRYWINYNYFYFYHIIVWEGKKEKFPGTKEQNYNISNYTSCHCEGFRVLNLVESIKTEATSFIPK